MPRQMLKTEGMKLFQPRLGGRSTLAHKMTYYESICQEPPAGPGSKCRNDAAVMPHEVESRHHVHRDFVSSGTPLHRIDACSVFRKQSLYARMEREWKCAAVELPALMN